MCWILDILDNLDNLDKDGMDNLEDVDDMRCEGLPQRESLRTAAFCVLAKERSNQQKPNFFQLLDTPKTEIISSAGHAKNYGRLR